MTQNYLDLVKRLEPPYCYFVYAASNNGEADYMHYGLWRQHTKTIKQAQENLSDLVKSYIPESVISVLDSGCGLGRSTWDLTQQGCDVIGISPHENTIIMAQTKYKKIKDRFITRSLQRFNSDSQFDLIFLQESSQYIESRVLFEKCAQLCKQDGYVLICDEVRYSEKVEGFNRKDEMLQFAGVRGFKVRKNDAITDLVLPTREFLVRTLRDNVDEFIDTFRDTGRDVKKEVLDLAQGWENQTRLFTSKLCGYEIFLFEKVKSEERCR